eukprot:m51a1_g14607 putative adenylate cyclase type 2-like (1052) ;mRNA; f:1196229-1199997
MTEYEVPCSPSATSLRPVDAAGRLNPPELRLRPLTQCFAHADIEASYCRHHILAHTGVLALFAAVFGAVSLAESHGGRSCPARSFLPFDAASVLVVAASALVAARFSRSLDPVVLVRLQQASFALCSTLLMAAAFVGVFRCRDSGADSLAERMCVPQAFHATAVAWLSLTALTFFGATPWPYNALLLAYSYSGHAVLSVYVVAAEPRSWHAWWWAALLLCAWGVVALYAAMASWERRKDFALSLLLERERRQMYQEKAATDALISSAFPKSVAAELIAARTSSSSTATATSSLAPPGSRAPRRAEALPAGLLLAHEHKSAVSVHIVVDGADHIVEGEERLRCLSRVFASVDNLATLHGAERVKSVETTVHYAFGITPQSGDDNERRACNFAMALHSMAGSLESTAGWKVLFRVGISKGPVVTGVIGSQKPRYDAWGYTVLVSQRLAHCAQHGTTLVTKDIATDLQNEMSFVVEEGNVFVPGIGAIMNYQLQPSAPIDFPMECVNNVSGHRSFMAKASVPEVSLCAVARGSVALYHEPLNPATLAFPDPAKERLFVRMYVDKFLGHTRWHALAGAVIFCASGAATMRLHPRRVPVDVALALMIAAALSLFAFTFARLQRRRRRLFHAVALTLLAVLCAVVCFVYGVGEWTASRQLDGIVAWVLIASSVRLPWCLVAPLVLAIVPSSLPIFVLKKGEWGSFVWIALVVGWWVFVSRSRETESRQQFATFQLLRVRKNEYEQEKEAGSIILRSVLPDRILQCIKETPSGSMGQHEAFFSDSVESATIMVCSIVDFEWLFQQHRAELVVRMLDSLFSRLDTMAMQRGLHPLASNSGDYTVVGNLFNDNDDHAAQVLELAKDVVDSMDAWNSEENPLENPVQLQTAVHTDKIFTGVTKTRCIQFDCWSRGLMVAEKVAHHCPPGFVLVTEQAAAAGKALADRIQSVEIGGQSVTLYVLRSASASALLCAPVLEANYRYSKYQPVAGIDFGVVDTSYRAGCSASQWFSPGSSDEFGSHDSFGEREREVPIPMASPACGMQEAALERLDSNEFLADVT